MRLTITKKVVGLTLAALALVGALALCVKTTRVVDAELDRHDAIAAGWVAGTVRLAWGERKKSGEPREVKDSYHEEVH